MIAILSALLLALGAYMLIGNSSNKKETGAETKLIVTKQCRPVENQCEILGEGMEMHLKFHAVPSYQRLLPISLVSKTSLDEVAMSLIIGGKEDDPVKMKNSGDNKNWTIDIMPFETVTPDNIKVRLEVSYKASMYLVEFPVMY